jgi:hypothetical protein
MTQLETDLRATLHEHAAPVHASSRLLAADYRPRTRRMRTPAAIGGGLATAAAAIAAALSLTGGTSSAFAGWTPAPTTPAPGQLATAEAYCSNNVPFAGLPLRLADTRGPFTFMIYSEDGGTNDFCTIGPSFRNASGWMASPPMTAPSGQLFLWAEHTSTDSGQPYTSLIARAGDDLTAADLTLDDGTQVTATVENGWAVAWWPGSQRLASAQLTTPTGMQTQAFPPNPRDG